MSEYIERETAIAWFVPYAHAGESIDADVVISDIKGMKPADVAPVRHGRWVHEHISEGYAWVICSECEAVIHKILINKRLNYCPNCGAKMDL